MDANENTSRTLTQISAVLQIAHRDEIDALHDALLKDEANKAIFKATASWAKTAEIEKAVVGGKTALAPPCTGVWTIWPTAPCWNGARQATRPNIETAA